MYLVALSMLVAAMTTSVAMAQSRGPSGADGSYNCADFDTQAQAQSYYEAQGGLSGGDPDGLDRDQDGLACEGSLPAGDDGTAAPADDETVAAPVGDSGSEDQYADGDQYAEEAEVGGLPDTGGPALLPLAGLLVVLGTAGFVAARARRRIR